MKIKMTIFIFFLFAFAISATAYDAGMGGESWDQMDSIKCGCCDILEKGDPVIKVTQCFGKPDYKDTKMIPADPFRGDEMVAGPEFWYYKKDNLTYRIKIEDGLVTGIEEMITG